MAVLGALAVIVGLIAFFFFEVPSYLKDKYYAVYLTPKLISVEKGGWGIKKSVQIVNNNPYPIYAVQIKLSEITSNSNIDDVQIKPQPDIMETTYSSSTDVNAFIISGYSKVDSKKWKRSIIYKIDPHSQINIMITIPTSLTAEKLKLAITDFRKEPINIFEDGNKTLFPFEIKN
jgi:hypothetical protein